MIPSRWFSMNLAEACNSCNTSILSQWVGTGPLMISNVSGARSLQTRIHASTACLMLLRLLTSALTNKQITISYLFKQSKPRSTILVSCTNPVLRSNSCTLKPGTRILETVSSATISPLSTAIIRITYYNQWVLYMMCSFNISLAASLDSSGKWRYLI